MGWGVGRWVGDGAPRLINAQAFRSKLNSALGGGSLVGEAGAEPLGEHRRQLGAALGRDGLRGGGGGEPMVRGGLVAGVACGVAGAAAAGAQDEFAAPVG